MRGGISSVSIHDLAIGIQRLDFDLRVVGGESVWVRIVGEGAVGGCEGGCRAGDEGPQCKVIEDFAAVSEGTLA